MSQGSCSSVDRRAFVTEPGTGRFAAGKLGSVPAGGGMTLSHERFNLGFPGVFKLPRIHEAGQMMQPVHGAGDGGPNRWLSYSHPRIFTA